MGKTLWISRKRLQPAKYLPRLSIWYQYSLRVLGAALGDATTQMLPAVPGEGRGVAQVDFSSCFATPLPGPRHLCRLALPGVIDGKPAKGSDRGRGKSGSGRGA